MIDCTVIYPALSTNAGTGLMLGDNTGDSAAIETYVAGCVFESNSSPPGGVGIQINNVEHVRVVNTRIEQFEQGIVITPGGSTHNARKLYFGNVSCFPTSAAPDTATGAAVLIQPTNSAWAVEIWFDCCELDGPDDSDSLSYTGAGVVLDPVNGAGGGGFIDQIRFTDSLPKTRSGKIMRRLLKEVASGSLETKGDTSTLEDLSVLAKLREKDED